MIEYIAHRRKMAALQRERRQVIAQMPAPKVGESFESDYDTFKELEIVEHKIYRLTSDHYWEKAFKYGVPVPSGEEYWEDSEAYPGTRHLNREGLRVLRSAIHEEQKRKAEFLAIWVAGLTGLVGAVTGLLAVLLNG